MSNVENTTTVAGTQVVVAPSRIDALRKIANENDMSIQTTKADTKSNAPVHTLVKHNWSEDGTKLEGTVIGTRASTAGIERLLNETLHGKPEKAAKEKAPAGVVKAAVDAVAAAVNVEKLSVLGAKVATALYRATNGNADEAVTDFKVAKADWTSEESIVISTGYSLGFDELNGFMRAAKALKLDVSIEGPGPDRLRITFSNSKRVETPAEGAPVENEQAAA